ncbi:MAG: hypothetical protein LC127_03545, partial [Chitinophagales bacterium]|nr:hypothetical protein [Chitinophagales bacterium]
MISEHGTQIQELPAESLHGVEAAVKDTVSLLPTLNDVSEAVEKVGTTLVSAFTKPDKALEHASESIQEFGNDSEVVAKGINDILKDYIGYIGAKNPEIARVVT